MSQTPNATRRGFFQALFVAPFVAATTVLRVPSQVAKKIPVALPQVAAYRLPEAELAAYRGGYCSARRQLEITLRECVNKMIADEAREAEPRQTREIVMNRHQRMPEDMVCAIEKLVNG